MLGVWGYCSLDILNAKLLTTIIQTLQTSCTGHGTFTLIYPLLCSVLTPPEGLEGCRCMHDFWKSWPANWHREIILFQVECIYLSETAKKFHFKEMVWLQSLKRVWFVDKPFGVYDYTCALWWWKDDADSIHMPHFHMWTLICFYSS